MRKSFPTLVIILLVLFFSVLRLYKLSQVPPSLFSDEVDIAYQVKSFLSTGRDYQGNFLPLAFHSFSDTRTSSNYTTALVSLLPGVSIDLAVRLTPVIFSILGLVGIYLLTNNLFKTLNLQEKSIGINPGLLSSLLLSLTPWYFTYSRTGFEVAQLFTFIIFGLYWLNKYLNNKKTLYLLFSLFFLSLIPIVYNTAKLAILFAPFLFLTLPGFKEQLVSGKTLKLFLLVLFTPLIFVIFTGGTGQRFSEIALNTDPTLPTEVNFLRQADLGQNLIIGSTPSIASRVAHNKPLRIITSFVTNMLIPISTDYLFVKGDPNLRHSVPGWGMLLKVESLLIVVGLFWLVSGKKYRLLSFLGIFYLLSVVPSATTRDGATHATRTFMLILPLILSATYGLYRLCNHRIVSLFIVLILFFESFLYFHDYFVHYPVLSEREFHAGLKELVSEANKYPSQTVVLTRTYEPSLIFFLYYANFPPAVAQKLIPQGKITEGINAELNLEGVKVTGTNIYLASVRDFDKEDPLVLKNAIYVLPAKEAAGLVSRKQATKISDIYLPSGELIYSTILSATSSAKAH